MSNMCVLSTKRDFIEMVAENKTERERERERERCQRHGYLYIDLFWCDVINQLGWCSSCYVAFLCSYCFFHRAMYMVHDYGK